DIGGPRHNFQVGVADLSVVDRLLRLWHPIELLADQDPVPGHGVGDIAIEAHPVTCVVVAMLIPELGPGELSRKATCLELEQADQVLGLDELASDVVIGAKTLREDHEQSVQTTVCSVKSADQNLLHRTAPLAARPARCRPFPVLFPARLNRPSPLDCVIRSPSPAAAPPPPRAASPGRRPASSSRSRAPRRRASLCRTDTPPRVSPHRSPRPRAPAPG